MPGNEISNARLPRELEVSAEGMARKWKLWKQTFSFYAIATQLSTKPENVQAATFMSAIGPAATVIFNTFNLTDDEETDLELIKQKFDEYFAPKSNETYVRYLFFGCVQKESETFDEFLTNLKTKVNDCAFGALQESLLRDQIVRGVRSGKVRELLLAERELTLNKAVDICRATEQANSQFKEMYAKIEAKDTKEVLSLHKSNGAKQKNRGLMVAPSMSKSMLSASKNMSTRQCWRCGLVHELRSCPAFNVTCNSCRLKGHYARQCQKKKYKQGQFKKVHEVQDDDDDDDDVTYSCETLHIGELINLTKNKKTLENAWYTKVVFEGGVTANFKLDTGAQGDIITAAVARKIPVPLVKSSVKRLKSFNNGYTPVLGEITVNCNIQDNQVKLKLIVVQGNFNCVLGCDTCVKLGLVQRNLKSITIQEIGIKVPEQIFQGIGCIKDFEYDIELKTDANFTIYPPRRIPYAIRDQVKKEIDHMVKMKILVPVTHPTPAVSPLVIVKKGDTIRLCLDPTDINKAIKRRHFPLKTVEDIAARIGSAKYFTLLDAKKGFWQLRVTKRTSDYLTVNTPWGRYSFLRVPFGLSSAPEIFQQVMESILIDCENTQCSMDDILLWANSLEELRMLTTQVLQRLMDFGVRLNKGKCQFEKTQIKFLGHKFTSDGIEIDSDKVRAIGLLKTPTGITELQRFIGMINYVSKFIPNYSAISEPLRRLLQKTVLWEWSIDQERAFQQLKTALQNTPKLAFYDVNKPVVVSVDASSYAVGAVLLQEGRPVAYSTKALTPTQQRYPQIEKEAFAIRHGCKKFHDYIYGKSVTIETDHKPLEAIAKKPLVSAPPRLQRILFDVLQYSPNIVYKKGTAIPIPDALSRDCIVDQIAEDNDEVECFEVVLDLPIPLLSFQDLLAAVQEDEELQDLKQVILSGWPDNIKEVPRQLHKYWNYREELTVYEDLMFKAEQLVVPGTLKSEYLKLIHHGHLGIALSLQFAREIVYWHGMSKDIELYVQQCAVCQETAKSKNMEPLLMKPVPRYPWQRVASDLFQFAGHCYCLLVDSYSGYFDFIKLGDATTRAIITYLKDSFAIHGIPDILESDNGPQYSSDAFKTFMRDWKIRHITSSPHYPRANGLAERYVQIAKLILKRCKIDRSDYRLALLNWRNAPRDGLPSPAQRLFGRPTRGLIPMHPKMRLPRPSTTKSLQLAREKQRSISTKTTPSAAPFTEGQRVKLQAAPRHWVPATVSTALEAPRSYLVTTADGDTYRRNAAVIAPTKAVLNPKPNIVVHPSQLKVVKDSASSQTVPGDNPPKTTRCGRVVHAPVRLNL